LKLAKGSLKKGRHSVVVGKRHTPHPPGLCFFRTGKGWKSDSIACDERQEASEEGRLYLGVSLLYRDRKIVWE